MSDKEISITTGSISAEEREALNVVLPQDRIHELIKVLHFSQNGFSVAFSAMFNCIINAGQTKEHAEYIIGKVASELHKAVDLHYSGVLKEAGRKENGINIMSKELLEDRDKSKLN